MRLIISLIVVLTLTAGAFYFIKYPNLFPTNEKNEQAPAPTPDPETYAVTVTEIQYHREKLALQYQNAGTQQERQQVIQSAKALLELTMPSLMRCWLGTPWDFNGTASEPGGGQIACGYFVSTIMRDAGFKVERIRLAQQASQNILLTFLPRSKLQINTGIDYSEYVEIVKAKPYGIYIIGLDRHVGFLVHNADGLRFIHSGGLLKRVVDEAEKDAYAIEKSNYRVIGNLTESDELITQWLKQTEFPTHT